MAEQNQILATFENFTGGEYGRLSGENCAPNAFTGTNVWVYRDGSIGPRWGIGGVSMQNTGGQEWRAIGYNRNNDKFWWISRGSGPNKFIPYSVGYPLGFAVTTYGGTEIDRPSAEHPFDCVDDGADRTFVTVYGQKSYKVNHQANTCSTMGTGTAPGGRAITVFGERVVVGGFAGSENRLIFSAPNDIDTWPAGNFLDIARPGDVIVGLDTIRDTLVVSMDDGDVYLISGALGVNEVVRRFTALSQRGGALGPLAIAPSQRGILWRNRRRGQHDHHPQAFDGARMNDFDYLAGWETGDGLPVAVSQLYYLDDIAFVSVSGAALIMRGGAWSKHVFDWDDTPHADTDVMLTRAQDALVMAVNDHNNQGLCRTLEVSQEAPIVLSDLPLHSDTAVGEGPPATFTTAERWDQQGRYLVPRYIQVEFTKYDTQGSGANATNHFDAWINCNDRYEEEGDSPTFFATFDEDPGEATAGGVRQSKLYGFQAPRCRSFSVTFSNLRGVKIRRVRVIGAREELRWS